MRFCLRFPHLASGCVPVRKWPKSLNTLDRDRTCNLQLRRLTLYPIELRGHSDTGSVATFPVTVSRPRHHGLFVSHGSDNGPLAAFPGFYQPSTGCNRLPPTGCKPRRGRSLTPLFSTRRLRVLVRRQKPTGCTATPQLRCLSYADLRSGGVPDRRCLGGRTAAWAVSILTIAVSPSPPEAASRCSRRR
jgi:hypothetical protein